MWFATKAEAASIAEGTQVSDTPADRESNILEACRKHLKAEAPASAPDSLEVEEVTEEAAEALANYSACRRQHLACEVSKLAHFAAVSGKGSRYWRRGLEAYLWLGGKRPKAGEHEEELPRGVHSDEEPGDEEGDGSGEDSASDGSILD